MTDKQQEKEDEELAREIERARDRPHTRQQARKVKFEKRGGTEEEESEVEEARSRKPPLKKSPAKPVAKSKEGQEGGEEDIVAQFNRQKDKMMIMHNAIAKKTKEMSDNKAKGIRNTEGIHQKAYEDKLKYLDRMIKMMEAMPKDAKVANITFGGKQLRKGTEQARVQTVIDKVQKERRNINEILKTYED